MKVYINDAFTLEKGKAKKVEFIEAPANGECCGYDCCEHILRGKDKATGVDSVSYIFNGSLVVESYDAYLAKKKAGNFNY